MLDLLALGEVHRVLADIRRQVRNALEVTAHEEKLQRGRDGRRALHHVCQQHAKSGFFERIRLVVPLADGPPQRAIGTNEGVDGVAEHFTRALRHLVDLEARRPRNGHVEETQRALRDVHRVVTDALEIARDLDCADDEAEIARHWLLQGEQRDRPLLDFYLEIVQLVIGGKYRFRFSRIALAQRFDGKIDERLGLLGHVEETLLELRELLMKVSKAGLPFAGRLWRCHPNLPVTYASVRSSRGLVNI